jgi:adenylate cyclase
VHTGVSYVGTVGAGDDLEFTALGDNVNITARLASAAGGREVLVSVAAAQAAGLDTSGLERRDLELKGKSEPVGVFVLTG